MSDDDRWYERERYDRERRDDERREAEARGAGRQYPARRFAGAGYLDRGHGPRIGPTGMVSGGPTGSWGTSGRYYEDYEGRAVYGGYEGGPGSAGAGFSRFARGEPDYRADDAGLSPDVQDRDPAARGYHDPQPRLAEREAYGDYAHRWGGYGAGGGYTPEPDEGLGREHRSFRHPAEDHRGRGPKGYRRSDARIHEDVNDRLTDDSLVDASDIEAEVAGGEVTLNGTVASRFAKRRAEDLAESVSGVSHVQNNLRVNAQAGGAVGSITDPRIAAVSEGKDADDAAKDYST